MYHVFLLVMTALVALVVQCAPDASEKSQPLSSYLDNSRVRGSEPSSFLMNPEVAKYREGILKGTVEFPIYFESGSISQGVGATFSIRNRLILYATNEIKLREKIERLENKKVVFVIDAFYPHSSSLYSLKNRDQIDKRIKRKLEALDAKYDFIIFAPLPTKGMLYVNSDLSKPEWNQKLFEEGRQNVREFFNLFEPSLTQRVKGFNPIEIINQNIVNFKAERQNRIFVMPMAKFLQTLVADGMVRGSKNIDYTIPELFSYPLVFNNLGQTVFINQVILPALNRVLEQLETELEIEDADKFKNLFSPQLVNQGMFNLQWVEDNKSLLFLGTEDFLDKKPGHYRFEVSDQAKFFKSGRVEPRTKISVFDLFSYVGFQAKSREMVKNNVKSIPMDFPISINNSGIIYINLKRSLNSKKTPLTITQGSENEPLKLEAYVVHSEKYNNNAIYNYHFKLEQVSKKSKQFKVSLIVYPKLVGQPDSMESQTLNIQDIDEIRQNGSSYPKLTFTGFGHFVGD